MIAKELIPFIVEAMIQDTSNMKAEIKKLKFEIAELRGDFKE